MRKVFLIFCISLFLFGNMVNSFAWDSTTAKYMPLQVGNVWIYYSTMRYATPDPPLFSIIKYKVSGITDTLGRKYYRLEKTIININGNTLCNRLPSLLRIDSLSKNIYTNGVGCFGYDLLVDSLLSQKYDTSVCGLSKKICVDTSSMTVFNSQRKIKKFINDDFIEMIFCSEIGLYKYSSFGVNSWCIDSLRGCVINGILYGDTSTIIGISNISTEIPENFSLSQNYPNPFNPVTKIKFTVSGTSVAQTFLNVYDDLGHEITVLVNQQLRPGSYETDWDASAYPSGVYYYKLEINNPSTPLRVTETKKMVLIK